jgi:predicted GH43/DUF377 family glycosyl hydrolase
MTDNFFLYLSDILHDPSFQKLFLFFIVSLIVVWFLTFEKTRLEKRRKIALQRFSQNPILTPMEDFLWEKEAVFNPAAFYDKGRVHLLYRAIGPEGISRIGYASSVDGIHFDERLPYPIYEARGGFTESTARRLHGPAGYDMIAYPSGGGWGGVEDPRIVKIDDRLYMTFVAFDGWGFVRMAFTSISTKDFFRKIWKWRTPSLISPPGEIHKNWVLFPEKLDGKYAVLHSISPSVSIAYVDSLEEFDDENVFIKSQYKKSGRDGHWDSWVRGVGPPPIKTKHGWLVLYHAMDNNDPNRYKIGAMILDKHDPTKILYRSDEPLLEPDHWYENDGKPGVVYSCGAVVLDDDLIIYYGGGDKVIAAAKINLEHFIQNLIAHKSEMFTPRPVVVETSIV